MSEHIMKKMVKPAAWIFYLIIGVEILYMISPFAIYYYSTYGPSLNFFHQTSYTAWLTGFFLPHFVKTSSLVLNSYHYTGQGLVVAGILLFLIGAGQIYYYKFMRKGAVTGGLYKIIRHPQYTAFAILGFGLLLVWPRFTVLIMYVTMLFVYFALARKEEHECETKFGESYRDYKARTSMFVPIRFSILERFPPLPNQRYIKWGVHFSLYVFTLITALQVAFALRSYSLSKVATHYAQNAATIATDFLSKEEIEKVLSIVAANPNVQSRLNAVQNGTPEVFLNYVVPADWYLADLPLEEIPEGFHGHHQPEKVNRDEYKVLYTKAKLSQPGPVSGQKIIETTYGREPVLVAFVNTASLAVTAVKTPPEHVLWGDIPTPLF